jgi:hypothetical protein
MFINSSPWGSTPSTQPGDHPCIMLTSVGGEPERRGLVLSPAPEEEEQRQSLCSERQDAQRHARCPSKRSCTRSPVTTFQMRRPKAPGTPRTSRIWLQRKYSRFFVQRLSVELRHFFLEGYVSFWRGVRPFVEGGTFGPKPRLRNAFHHCASTIDGSVTAHG